MIDLHVHTVESGDADHTRAEVLTMARQAGVSVLAFCEHDNLASARLSPHVFGGLLLVRAIEITCDWQGEEVHVLGYGIDPASRELGELVAGIEGERLRQCARRARTLREMGFQLEDEAILAAAAGRPPTVSAILKALVRANLGHPALRNYQRAGVYDYRGFMADYLAAGRPAHVPAAWPGAAVAAGAIRRAGGRAVLAHPGAYRGLDRGRLLAELVGAGLAGLEVYSTYHDPASFPRWERVAREHGLVATMGSDYHGPSIKPGVKVGDPANVPAAAVDRARAWVDEL